MGEIGRRLVRVGKRVEIETFDVPEPGHGQLLLRVSRSQVSGGSEGRGFHRDSAAPRAMGYTTVGRVQAAGPGMEDYKPGDRVIAFGNHGTHWLTGQPSHSDIGPSFQRIEYDITDEQAAFTRLGDVALHAVHRAELQIDESVAIFGQGVIGQLLAGLCRLSGAYPVIGIDLDADRLALSERSGATHAVDASAEDGVEAVRTITEMPTESGSTGTATGYPPGPGGGWGHEHEGAQSVFHATRSAKTLIDCMKAASDRGKIVLIASPFDRPPYQPRGQARGSQRALSAHRGRPQGLDERFLRLGRLEANKELQIRGSSAMTGIERGPHPYWPWTLQRNRRAIMRMIATGDLKVDHLISHVAKPEEANELYQHIAAGLSPRAG